MLIIIFTVGMSLGIGIGMEHPYEKSALECLQHSENPQTCKDYLLEHIDRRL